MEKKMDTTIMGLGFGVYKEWKRKMESTIKVFH